MTPIRSLLRVRIPAGWTRAMAVWDPARRLRNPSLTLPARMCVRLGWEGVIAVAALDAYVQKCLEVART